MPRFVNGVFICLFLLLAALACFYNARLILEGPVEMSTYDPSPFNFDRRSQ